MDEAYFGELVGGTGEHRFRVGGASEIVIPEDVSGELFLAANDFLLPSPRAGPGDEVA